MPSPFPGMDPYLEGEEWSDVHQAMAAQIRKQLSPKITPKYVARLVVATVPDFPPEQEIEIMYPDLKIVLSKPGAGESPTTLGMGSGVTLLEPPITKPVIVPLPTLRVRLVTVEIREVETNQLVTSIEVLSPVNKRNPGLTKFREKRERLMRAGVHLLDIDFIRRGKRPVDRIANDPHYLVTLTRSHSKQLEFWPIAVQDPLPVVAVPLRLPDSDVSLDLGETLKSIYDEAAYHLTIDYRQPPPPPAFDPGTQAWMLKLLQDYQS